MYAQLELILHQSLGGRAASTCMKPPPADARNSPEQGVGAGRRSVGTWKVSGQTHLGDERNLEGKVRSPNSIGTGGCRTFVFKFFSNLVRVMNQLKSFIAERN